MDWLEQLPVKELMKQGQITKRRLDSKNKPFVVKEMRSLTVLPAAEFLPQLQQLCRDSGVVFVLVSSIPRAHVSGVARWLNPHKALIQLSLYGKSNDRFWLTFFHKVAHILLHGK